MEPEDDEPRRSADGLAADGVDHLQRAAREVIGAARSFLDAVEEMVDDRDRLSGAAERIAGVVSDLVDRSAARSPWGDPDDDVDLDDDVADEVVDDPDPDGADTGGPARSGTAPESGGPKKVRRIQVD